MVPFCATPFPQSKKVEKNKRKVLPSPGVPPSPKALEAFIPLYQEMWEKIKI